MASYCEESDLYDFGLPRGAVPNPGRLAEGASASTDAISLDMHGFALDDAVVFRADGANASLPAPLVEGTTYYAKPLSQFSFQVAATAGGAAIDLTTAGQYILVIAPLNIAAAIEWASTIVDDMLPSHVVPLESPYPRIVVMTCAELAFGKLAGRGGSASAALMKMVDEASKRITRWAQGVPLRGVNAPDTHTNTAASASVSTVADPRGWSRYGGIN